MIQVLSAMRHRHSKKRIEEWLGDSVEIIALSPSPRKIMTREYIWQVVEEILRGVSKIHPSSRVIFLMTGHPYFNYIAAYLLSKTLENPFLIMVYDGHSYQAYSSYTPLLNTAEIVRKRFVHGTA